MKSILSINNNKPMSYLLRTVLQDKHKLISVTDIFHAQLELKKNRGIELIIVDLDYHTENNIAFVKHLNSSWLFQRPVIVLTSQQNKELTDRLTECNVCDILVKPFSPVELLKSIDELINTSTLA